MSTNNFRTIVEGNTPYVDKTETLFKLLSHPDTYYTFSRPDGFGKTTLLDTLEALFSGQKALFRGLYIEDKWNFEDTYPVIRIDLSLVSVESSELFDQTFLRDVVLPQAKALGIDGIKEDGYPSTWMNQLITGAGENYGKDAVILIDNFDRPLLASVDADNFKSISDSVYSVFSCLKPRGSDIRFCFLAGVTRYTPNTIFSGFNNAVDISDDPDYATLCGFTDNEVYRYFTPYFEKAGITSDEEKKVFREQVREYYGGYRFSYRSDMALYNPMSLTRFVGGGCTFKSYWSDTATLPLTRKVVEADVERLNGKDVFRMSDRSITVFEIQELLKERHSPYLLYSYLRQVGYLTIDKENEFGDFELCYPNREAEDLMARIIRKV